MGIDTVSNTSLNDQDYTKETQNYSINDENNCVYTQQHSDKILKTSIKYAGSVMEETLCLISL